VTASPARDVLASVITGGAAGSPAARAAGAGQTSEDREPGASGREKTSARGATFKGEGEDRRRRQILYRPSPRLGRHSRDRNTR
jgi:hypothetical protein